MRRKIAIGLIVYSVVFLSVGGYIIRSIGVATANLDRLVTLHRVEILREHFLLQIRKVQSNLALKGTAYSKGYDTTVVNVMNMGKMIDTCFDCHHSPRGIDRLDGLKKHTEEYKEVLSRILTIRANPERVAMEQHAALRAGEDLIAEVQAMVAMTSSRLENKTQQAMREIDRTKYFLYGLVALAPLVSALLGFFFISGLTRPVKVLVESTRKLKGGDLDHRVGKMKDEFGELGDSFNEMAGALREQVFQLRDAERTLAKANRELKLAQEQMVRAETMAAIGTLSTGISHELTTPLSVILNMAQLTMQDAGNNTSLRKDLEVIESEANQAIRITRSLLGFARSTKSKKEEVDVNRILEDLFKILEFQPAAKKIRIVQEMDPGLKPIVANAGQIRQVLLNIILNAVQAMGDSGELRVETANESDEGSDGVVIRIADTGPGIPEDQIKGIFQPFFTTKEEGTGLGLAIAYGIIQEHNGKIDVASRVGEGTTFRIALPGGRDGEGA